MSKNIEEGGWGSGSGNHPPSAAVYDSEGERLAALTPKADEEALMKARRLKVEKLISKKTGTTFNPRKVRYQYITPEYFGGRFEYVRKSRNFTLTFRPTSHYEYHTVLLFPFCCLLPL